MTAGAAATAERAAEVGLKWVESWFPLMCVNLLFVCWVKMEKNRGIVNMNMVIWWIRFCIINGDKIEVPKEVRTGHVDVIHT